MHAGYAAKPRCFVGWRPSLVAVRPERASLIITGMLIYAGVDEAGYGPLFGPMVVGRFVLAVDGHAADAMPDLWASLEQAVCRDKGQRRGRLVVNDSKKVLSRKAGEADLSHLERGVLAFLALAEHDCRDVGRLLDVLGERTHRELNAMPWYAPTDAAAWDALPSCCTADEIGVACSLLRTTAGKQGVRVVDAGAAIVFEDRFNRMVAATRSKAAVNFTFVTQHLQGIWDRFGRHAPTVIVDRQSGRTYYRELLSQVFEHAHLSILEETESCSAYLIDQPAVGRSMTVRFEVESEHRHMPVALASMVSKYARELMMARFARWFSHRLPEVKPTAGYGSDGKRFWLEVRPHLARLGIDPEALRRQA
jgi:ribonuclease HII